MILDAHAHCGRQFREPPQDFQAYLDAGEGTGIEGVVMFPPVMEVYDRNNPDFEDDEYWRRRREAANKYLLELGGAGLEVFPFFFIWNDFAVERLEPDFQGIKWHRHADEPRYDYQHPRCAAAIKEIRRRNLPVMLEEELENTMHFLDELAPDLRVIIPHCGALNGGYHELQRLGVWARENVYTDTSVAPLESTIIDYVDRHGHERLLFGTDFPFGGPAGELEKVRACSFTDAVTQDILGGNLRRLLAANRDI